MFDFYGYKYVKDAKEKILNRSNPNWEHDVRIAMSKVYRYYKKVLPSFKNNMKSLLKVFELEDLMSEYFLPIDSKPIIYLDYSIPDTVRTEEDAENVVKYVVSNERIRLAVSCDGAEELEKASLACMCIISSDNVSEFCQKSNISCKEYKCSTSLSEGMFHAFCILDFNLEDGTTKKYLVDCTYRQFFTYRNYFLERVGLVGFPGGSIGRFMMMDESRMETAHQLLKYGYMEMTPENVKNYFDGFFFAGRNGGYYAEQGKDFLDSSDYDVEYDYTDYLDAIDGKITLPNDWMDILYTRISNPDIVFDYDLLNNTKESNRSNYRMSK